MTPTLKLGPKVRGFRRKEQLTQVQLAERLDISPSYLNLIEHNQRPLPAHLLVKLAQIFHVDLAAFADDSHARIADSLQEVFADPLLEEHSVTTNDVRELAESAAASRAIIALFHAYKSSVQSMRDLASQMHDGSVLHGIDPVHLPSEEASDVIQENLNYFPELETAADDVTRSASLDRSDLYRSIVTHLRARHGVEVVLTPVGARPRLHPPLRPGIAHAFSLRGAAAVEPAVPGGASAGTDRGQQRDRRHRGALAQEPEYAGVGEALPRGAGQLLRRRAADGRTTRSIGSPRMCGTTSSCCNTTTPPVGSRCAIG